MVTRLKAKDMPEPWHSSKKSTTGTQVQKSSRSEVSPAEDNDVQNAEFKQKRRGRPPGKSATKLVGSTKGAKKKRPLPPSAVDVLLSLSQTSVADVEELRRKRQEDAAACGRVVRTVSALPKTKSTATPVTENGNAENGSTDAAAVKATEDRASPPPYSRFSSPLGPKTGEQANNMTVLEQPRDESEPILRHRPGKEPVTREANDAIPPSTNKQACPQRLGEYVGIESNADLEERTEVRQSRQGFRGRSPHTRYSREEYRGRHSEFGESSLKGLGAYRQRSRQSLSRSPKRRLYRKSPVLECWSPQRSASSSPVRGSGRRRRSADRDFEDYGEQGFVQRHREEYWNEGPFYGGERQRRRERQSSSPESYRRQRRSRPRDLGRTIQQENRTAYYSMSSPRRSKISDDVMPKESLAVGGSKQEERPQTSTVSGRRLRRRDQALLQAEKARRGREGKKAFYLIVDSEGKPYGPGKPSWIAEINKLAKSLDPSCTHIRKQTYEDVQMFRERLDENFEYSSPLNEDYLRALMGRAVTKIRTELINFIQSNGERQKHIDKEVWLRLEKLATSKQREQKSEQGRHANACRKVISRSGRRGLDGVREQLRNLLGRSPDPSEVEEEMHRDKGYGGRKRKSNVLGFREEKNSAEAVLKEDLGARRSESKSRRWSSDAGYEESFECHDGLVTEGIRRSREYVHEEGDAVKTLTDCEHGSFTDTDSNEMTKDDFIEKLKAEIKLLHEEKAKTSTSNADAINRKRMN